MSQLEEWARSFGISCDAVAPAIEDYDKPCPKSGSEIAIRAVVLQGLAAVAFEVDPEPIVKWFHDQGIWDHVTPREREFLAAESLDEDQCLQFQWHQEAEWTLLWTIRMVDVLGLPTCCCDTRRLVDEIIAPLGSDIQEFTKKAKLRSPGELLAEDDRTYDLWCRAQAARRDGKPVPQELNLDVLYERRYAFEWLSGTEEWDDVTCDA